MKAYFLQKGTTGPENLKLAERADPQPGQREILVRVRAVSLNYRDQMIARDAHPAGKTIVDTIPCSDGAGEVIAVGPGVTRFAVGDRVASTYDLGWTGGAFGDFPRPSRGQPGADGMLAELVVLDQEDAVRIPEGLSFEQAACLPCAAVTAWTALVDMGGMTLGQTVLTQGTGGVSIFALQFAKATGCRVIITSSSDEKLAKAKALGADELINYRTTPDWAAAARELTGGRGVDQIVEIGGVGTLGQSYRALAIGGNIGLIGFLAEVDEVPPPAMPRSGKLNRLSVGSRESFEAMNRCIAQNHIKPVIDRVFPFERAIEAYQYMLTAQHFGKIVIAIP